MWFAIALVVAIALVAGAMSSFGDDDADEAAELRTFQTSGAPFTFRYPADFKPDADPRRTSGATFLAVLRLDPRSQINARLAFERKLSDEQIAAAVGRDLRRQKRPPAAVEAERHSGVHMVRFSVPGRPSSSQLYFFASQGKTWELECQATRERAERVQAACDTVLRSLRLG